MALMSTWLRNKTVDKNSKIYVAGHNGMVGSAIFRLLTANGYQNIITRSHHALDLTQQQLVAEFMQAEKPDYVILAAAKVGGIFANNEYPAEFIYQNLMIETNVIHQAYLAGVTKLLLLGSSCIYPKFAQQPMAENSLLTGILEPTNEPYAIAKIAGIKLCESYNRQYGTDYRSVMPTNLYGEGDNFDLQNSHVIPALIRKIHEAKVNQQLCVELWGTGHAKREFLHVNDMADACYHVMTLDREIFKHHTQPMLSHINIGLGKDVSIKELAETIAEIVGFNGNIVWNTDMPDGTPRKLLDVGLIKKLGWQAKISLKEGLMQTYQWYLDNYCDTNQ